MSRNVGTISQGGKFFKPAEHINDIAIVVEAQSLFHNATNAYKGNPQPRDEVTADITIFKSQESLERGAPDEVIKGGKIVHGALVNSVKENLPMEYHVIVRKESFSSGNSGYVFREVDAGTGKKLVAYLDKRDAELKAALESVPDFD